MKNKVLYFDCFAGISGDMTVGALIDLGADEKELLQSLDSLHLHGYRIEIKKALKNGISGTDFNVIIEEDHSHHSHHHHHHSRNLSDISNIINSSPLDSSVKELSLKIFHEIAAAESKIHAKSIDEIHFHEVGAIDSIVDIVASAVCLNMIKPDKIISSPLNLGEGTVECDHGVFPVPAPATAEILKRIPVYSSGIKKEMTTPTGAAIIKCIAEEFSSFPAMKIDSTGYGLGKRNLEVPNVLRAVIGEMDYSEKKVMIETNIDDMSGELFSCILPKLLDAGALDVFITPVIMKKSRPGHVLSVLCESGKVDVLEEIIFTETTTFGTRRYEVERSELERSISKVKTSYGEISVKKGYMNGKCLKFSPEYEECAQAAQRHGVPVREVYNAVTAQLKKSED
ncbi:MAG TPA: nickel pincer cofactor biosynthesis protein LarC [Spirochaetota bacterium]|nr:nickel pincer cofactor biosynthesis protein LarC [Spirochaetota bacterium]HOR44840.1 nickel pincer cofactor biosynthesis protein LarC [Spirochaetota bacterium]HPK56147.1 nickel pincer cofactor biosynthesis protein LarC [Spirochaetota bacterium]